MADGGPVQPSWESDVAEWRRYAGQLRQQIGKLRAELRDVREAHLTLREDHLTLQEQHARLNTARRRDRQMLNAVERDLEDGDVPAAVDRLADRRRRITAAVDQRRSG